MQIPSLPIPSAARCWLAYVLGAVALAADALHAVASRLSPPRTVDAIARTYVDEVAGPDGPPVWVAAAREMTEPPPRAEDDEAYIAWAKRAGIEA